MASRLYKLDITVPAKTAQLTPILTQWPLEDCILNSIRIVVPPGHVGLTGIRILQSQQQIIPWGNLSYLVMDNDKYDVQINSEIGASAISVAAYNTDIYNHTFYLRAQISDISSTPTTPILPVAAATVSTLDATPGTAPLAAGIPQSDLTQALASEGLVAPDLTQGVEVSL